MELSRSRKIMLGLATAWPPIYILFFIIMIFAIAMISSLGPNPGGGLEPFFGGAFLVLFVFHMITILLSLGLTVVYIVHAVKNAQLDGNMRIIWIVLFFFAGMLAQPVYWYLEIWKARKPLVGELPSPGESGWIKAEMDRQTTFEPPDWR